MCRRNLDTGGPLAGIPGQEGVIAMAVHPDDRRIAKKVVELKLLSREKVQEAGRILAVRGDVGEPTSLDQVLFERELLSPTEVLKLQRALALRCAYCPGCQARLNVWKEKPGASVRCPECRKAKVAVPGGDREDPFKAASAHPPAGSAARDGGGLTTLGVLGTFLAGALLVDTAVESRATHMALPAAVCAGSYALLAPLLGSRLRWPTTAALGVTLFTGLAVACGLGNAPGARALVTFGHDAHLALAPLVLFHLLLLLVAGQHLLIRARPLLLLVGVLPLVWGLLFFAWRSVPGTDPAVWLSGPGPLARLPWYAHPGAVTLLFVFPLGALLFLLAGLKGLFARQPLLLLRRASLAASLLLLGGFGLAIGAASQRIPEPALQRQVDTRLAGRVAPFWTQGDPRPAKGSVAAALTSR